MGELVWSMTKITIVRIVYVVSIDSLNCYAKPGLISKATNYETVAKAGQTNGLTGQSGIEVLMAIRERLPAPEEISEILSSAAGRQSRALSNVLLVPQQR